MLQPPLRISDGGASPRDRRGGLRAEGFDPVPEFDQRSASGFGGRGRDRLVAGPGLPDDLIRKICVDNPLETYSRLKETTP